MSEALSSLVLVAMVGGTRPWVSPTDVCDLLVSFYHVPHDAFTISRYSPEDFLVYFNNTDDLMEVLHGPVPVATPFSLIWKRWCH